MSYRPHNNSPQSYPRGGGRGGGSYQSQRPMQHHNSSYSPRERPIRPHFNQSRPSFQQDRFSNGPPRPAHAPMHQHQPPSRFNEMRPRGPGIRQSRPPNPYSQSVRPTSISTGPPKHDNFPPKRDNFPPKRDNFPPPKHDNFPPKRDNFPPPKHDNFPPKRDNFPPPKHDNFPPPKRDNFPPPKHDKFPPPKFDKFPPPPTKQHSANIPPNPTLPTMPMPLRPPQQDFTPYAQRNGQRDSLLRQPMTPEESRFMNRHMGAKDGKRPGGIFDDDDDRSNRLRRYDGSRGSQYNRGGRNFGKRESEFDKDGRDISGMKRSNSTSQNPGRGGYNVKLNRHQSMQGGQNSRRSSFREGDDENGDGGWESSKNTTNISFKRLSQPKFDRMMPGNNKEQNDYIRTICKRVQTKKEKREQTDREKGLPQQPASSFEASITADKKLPVKGVQMQTAAQSGSSLTKQLRIKESMKIAELFYLLNDTNWNKFDEKFYLINRRWFDRWKDFISYDYIVKQLVELGLPETALSINRLLQSNSNPGEISNQQLILDHRDFMKNRCEKMAFCNFALKKDIVPERDLIFLTQPIWKTLHTKYGGEEIRRYAVQKNSASILERSPFLPSLLICLVLFEEQIRPFRQLVVPLRSKFKDVKGVVRESYPWLKDLEKENFRFWRLYPDVRDQEFLDQYNQQLQIGQLPELLKFPGYSLEKSMDFYIEEYGNIQFQKQVVFVEVKKQRSQWVFSFDGADKNQFDEGATNPSMHKKIYTEQTGEGAVAVGGHYSQYYKYHNNTNRDYFQFPGYQEEGKEQLFKTMSEQQKASASKAIYDKVFEQMDACLNQPASERLSQQPDEASEKQDETIESVNRIKPRARAQSLDKRPAKSYPESNTPLVSRKSITPTTIEFAKHAVCNKCGTKQTLDQVIFCKACAQTAYCSETCRTSNKRSHVKECSKRYKVEDSDVEMASGDENSEQTDGKSENNSAKRLADGIESEEDNISQKQTLKLKRKEKSDRKAIKQQQVHDHKLNTSTQIKDLADSADKTNQDSISKRQKTSHIFLAAQRSVEIVETATQKPAMIRPIKTSSDQSIQKLASLISLMTQIRPLRESIVTRGSRYENDPFMSALKDFFHNILIPQEALQDNDLVPADPSTVSTFELNESSNTLKHFIDQNNQIPEMFRQLVTNLNRDNPQLANDMKSRLKTLQTCINCGNQESGDSEVSSLSLSNEKEEFSMALSVTLRVIYIYDSDQYKKYELRLRPGEYSYQEVIAKIKDRIQNDRVYVKLCKRTFILVDLFEQSALSQVFTNEQMKFSFVKDQILTCFAYEVSKTLKDRVKRQHFVHIVKVNEQNKVTYNSFPRLVIYNDQDPLKVVALKVLRHLRPLLYSSGLTNDPDHMEMNESEAYQHFFTAKSQAYDMVYVLKNGTRWKLEPQVHQTKKLNSTVDLENVVRFECILTPSANLDAENANYKTEISRDIVPMEQRGVFELELCFKNLCKQSELSSDEMAEPCKGCNQKKGAKKLVEISRIGNYIGIEVHRIYNAHGVHHPLKLCLDKYVTRQAFNPQSSVFDLIGFIGIKEGDTQEQQKGEGQQMANGNLFFMLKASQPKVWYKYSYANNNKTPSCQIITCDQNSSEITTDPSITFALYRKEQKAPVQLTTKRGAQNSTQHSTFN